MTALFSALSSRVSESLHCSTPFVRRFEHLHTIFFLPFLAHVTLRYSCPHLPHSRKFFNFFKWRLHALPDWHVTDACFFCNLTESHTFKKIKVQPLLLYLREWLHCFLQGFQIHLVNNHILQWFCLTCHLFFRLTFYVTTCCEVAQVPHFLCMFLPAE